MKTTAKRAEVISIPRRAGRLPSFPFSEAIADEIYCLMIEGNDLGTICQRPGMPSRYQVDYWRVHHPEFAAQLARARECLAHVEFDKIKELIENCTEANANATRVKIQAYQWRVMKLSPRSYGDKTTIEATATVNASHTRTLDVSGLDVSEMLALEKALMKTIEHQG
jgi:hypothetical protein